MIEIWMRNHLVSENNCNIVIYNVQFLCKKWQNNYGLTFGACDITRGGLQLVLSKTNRIDDTKYNN